MEDPKSPGIVEYLVNLTNPFMFNCVGAFSSLLLIAVTVVAVAVCSTIAIQFFQLTGRYWNSWKEKRLEAPPSMVFDWGNKTVTVKEAEIRKEDLSSQKDTSDAVRVLEERHDAEWADMAEVVAGLYQSVDELQAAVVEIRGLLEAEKARNRWWWSN